MVFLDNDWDDLLKAEFEKEYYQQLRRFLKFAYQHHIVYPDKHDIYNALKHTAYREVKVVILGQDPYHGKGQAHGFCFSVQPGVPSPPSLQNIFKEMGADVGIAPPKNGDLTHLADQGVLLLNTVLTVEEGTPQSHQGKGWETLTDAIITRLSARATPMVFLLWGAPARAKKRLIADHHLVLESPHPSPLSAHRGFFGNRHFSKTNEFLTAHGQSPIQWGESC